LYFVLGMGPDERACGDEGFVEELDVAAAIGRYWGGCACVRGVGGCFEGAKRRCAEAVFGAGADGEVSEEEAWWQGACIEERGGRWWCRR
jgi:hypothetical protein